MASPSETIGAPDGVGRARLHALLLAWAILALGFWTVWRWYGLRLVDGADEKWGVSALVVVAALAWKRRQLRALPTTALAVALAAYAATYSVLPPLGRAVFAVLAIGLLVARSCRGPHLALAGLLLLSLPVEATLQFALGYPLRFVVARCSAFLLHGFGVVAQGTSLHWAGETVLVDAPCGGLRMLWVALFLALTLAALQSLRATRTLFLVVCAVAAAFVGNVLRATALFFKETGLLPCPSWAHEAAGVAAFGGVAFVIVRVATRRSAPSDQPSLPVAFKEPTVPGLLAFAVAGFAAAFVPLMVLAPAPSNASPFPGWPLLLDGEPLAPLPLDSRAAEWAADFPGRLATFAAEDRQILLRWVPGPTRRLHPSADCYRGLGYKATPLPAKRDAKGIIWSCSLARRGAESLRVCEHLTSADGQSFSDTSAWYWSALLGRSQGPYWAVTTAEAAGGSVG